MGRAAASTARKRDTTASASPLATALKWIGAVAAVISLTLGLVEVTKTFSALGERSREVGELRVLADQQQRSGDLAAAWSTLGRAAGLADEGGWLAKLTGRLDADRRELRRSQEDLAMHWLRDVRVPEGKKFADVVDPLIVVLGRGLPDANAPRQADLHAFVGWGYFLRSRDGTSDIDPDQHYRRALQIDAGNVFAHAHRGHWVAWRRGEVAEVERHFAAALATGRETAYVRHLQLAMLRNLRGGADEYAAGLVRIVSQMRRNGEPIDETTRRDLFYVYQHAVRSDGRFQRLLAAEPPAEQVATLRALMLGADFNRAMAQTRDWSLALLLDAAGAKDEALLMWRKLHAALDADAPTNLRVQAVRRLSATAPGGSAAK